MLHSNNIGQMNSDYSKITIGLMSPEKILETSYGEVTKAETLNYRTFKPERDGLFCERIFGPMKDYECYCGKYKGIRYKGIVCDRCGVEITRKKARRERTGHINLVVPVAHQWFFKINPNKIALLLGLTSKKLEVIVYYERYVVVQAGAAGELEEHSNLQKMDFLTEEEYYEIMEKLPPENQHLEDSDPNKFIASMGGIALQQLLARIEINELAFELRDRIANETSVQRKNDLLKRLKVVQAFRKSNENIVNKLEWMVLKVIPVIPPDLRPLVALDGGHFASSDLNDLYRRIIIRNNRLKKLIDIKAPDVILRNEKRMLQEAVDALIDNSKKAASFKSESHRVYKSLSENLKGKQGRFRQNLLGKRVDYSARSVIVVGPRLEMHECGIPKEMAAEIYKPFIIRKIIERGIVKTVKSAKKVIDNREPVVWDILENVMKGHPVLLNRAPTLHRLGIQAFQPKLVEGKAIRLHPLVCTAFNADFDGDQMALHLPLSHEAVIEANLLMLASHNILNPANGAPITVPSQDMVLGLYYLSKLRPKSDEFVAKGTGMTFSSDEEAIMAYNHKMVDLHSSVNCLVEDVDEDKKLIKRLVKDTSVGRLLFNQKIPQEVGYVNEVLTKKSLRDIIYKVLVHTSIAQTAKFLDEIKTLGFEMAYKGGLSFNLGDIIIPEQKKSLIKEANKKVDEVKANYSNGFITTNERYNQVIDIWTSTNTTLTRELMDQISTNKDGFNSVYMMLDSGARGSKEQIRQLSGMRGLMAKPQRSSASGGEIIENPIISNFKEGLSVLEYFISTNGARKGLTDTALKTADAGYLTRRLVDVSQDVIIREIDCGTLRGYSAKALRKNEEVVESLYDRIIGRTLLNDVIDPLTKEVLGKEGQEIDHFVAQKIEASPVDKVDIRSVLTCEAKSGVCVKCYGRNLVTGKMVNIGEAVGIVAAQSIGEPGTQLTLRTFHVGGTASSSAATSKLVAKFDGVIEIDDLRTVKNKEEKTELVVGRSAEIRLIDHKTKNVLSTNNIPYGSNIFVKNGESVKKGKVFCEWDPYNAVIIAEKNGKSEFDYIIEGQSYKIEADEQTGFQERVIIDSRDKTKNPSIIINNKDGAGIYNLPVGAHIMINEGEDIKVGEILVKIPRSVGKSGDITGGLPRVTELFEARNPSNPAVVSEIDGYVSFGRKKRGYREVTVKSKTGERERSYLVPLAKQFLVQENDFVKQGMPLCQGVITPNDILNIEGPTKLQEFLVNEIQEVYRLQGVKINDKHFEVIVRQMMKKVIIEEPGDTKFLKNEIVDKFDFKEEIEELFGKIVITDVGDSKTLKTGQIITLKTLREENSLLKRKDLNPVETREAVAATSKTILQGITRAALQTKSFVSAASFQETTKVLSEAAIAGKDDKLLGLKENVIVGHLIPAGTGMRKYQEILVGSKEEYESLQSEKEQVEEVES